jgi:hypothetical protein
MSNLSLETILANVYNGLGADPDDQQKVLIALGPEQAARYGIYPNETVPPPPPVIQPPDVAVEVIKADSRPVSEQAAEIAARALEAEKSKTVNKPVQQPKGGKK